MALSRNQRGDESPAQVNSNLSFQPYRPHAATALSPYPAGSNEAQSATDSPIATGPEMNLPELEPLTADEELEMVQLLLSLEPPCRQTMENADNLPTHNQQLQQPIHMGAPIPTVNYGAPGSSSLQSRPLPQHGMIDYCATHLHSCLPQGHHSRLQQSPQQPLADLHPDIHRQMLGSAPIEPCAMALPPSRTGFITASFPAIVEGAPTVVTGAGRRGRGRGRGCGRGCGRGRGRGNGLPQRSAATGERLRPILPAPTTNGLTMVFPARRNSAEESLSQVVWQRENLERHRRQMNHWFTTMRTPVPPNSLPATATMTRSDRARIWREMMHFIFRCRLYSLRSSTLRTRDE